MRRFVTLAFVLLFTIPFGVSISGCSHGNSVTYCNGASSGVPVGQVTNITLSPAIYGVSLNQAQILQSPVPTATDCNGTKQSVSKYTYAIFLNGKPDMTIADVNPSTGALCGGTWNRNTGGGIADYTTCNATGKQGTVYLVVSGSGTSSNPLPVFVHPVVTSVQLGALSTDCTNDPATNCSPAAFTNTGETCTLAANGNGCCSQPVPTAASGSSINGCVSQGVTSQLAARVFDSSGANISCAVGHLVYTAQTAAVVTIDQNGVATAQQPGSTVITATASNAGSSAGYFSTCPPKSIALSFPNGNNGSATSATVNPNSPQPINAIVTDTNNALITVTSLTFESTTPTTIPASQTVTPTYPGAADIFAVCQPPTCNPSPINQIGLNGNGKPVTSNPVSITAPGVQANKLYIGSTASRYVVPYDFSINNPAGQPVQLPYTPNSMMITTDGNTIYMGSQFALMTFSATTNAVTAADTTARGSVIGLSPDGTTLVISDPSYPAVYLYNTKTFVETRYPGIGTHAQFSPDSTTVYITLGDIDSAGTPGPMYDSCPTGDIPIEVQCIKPNKNSIVYSTFNPTTYGTSSQAGSDVAVAVPAVGAFFAGSATTARSVCAETTTTQGSTPGQATTTNIYYPDAGVIGASTERITATNDGLHLLGATSIGGSIFTDQTTSNPVTSTAGLPTGECPQADGQTQNFGLTTAFSGALPGVTASHITGIYPTSDSKIAFITFQTAQTSLGVLPAYIPQATGAGTLSNIPLSTAAGTPIAPLNGVVSTDNQTFYTGTSGDNAIHLVTKQSDGTYKDTTAPIVPKLTDPGNNIVAPNLLVQKPRAATS